MKKTTIKDVALKCGVSISTVSRAINNGDEISETTKKNILDTIKIMGYTPNQNARNLKITKNKTIAVVIKGITNPFFTPMLKVLEEQITKNKYTFSLHKVEETMSELDVAIKIVKTLKPEGIIFLGGYFVNDSKKLAALGVPFSITTIINNELKIKNSICVGVDDFEESKKIINYLIGLNHKKIAVIGPRIHDNSIGKLRLDGYKEALKENNINFNKNLIFYSSEEMNPYSLQHGYEAAKKIITTNTDCTAIFCISDTIAIGAIKAIYDMNKKVPEDFSVVGFDGLELNEFLIKPITTVVQPSDKIAYTSVKELFKIINKKNYSKITKYEAQLFIGKTTKNN